jgi:hypothetical protein
VSCSLRHLVFKYRIVPRTGIVLFSQPWPVPSFPFADNMTFFNRVQSSVLRVLLVLRSLVLISLQWSAGM